MEKLAQIINKIRANKGNAEPVALTPQTRLREDLAFDSFDLAELTVHVEDAFGKDIFEDGVVDTIADVCKRLGI